MPAWGFYHRLTVQALRWPAPKLQGAEGTAYEGCTFRLSLKFTSEYPFKPPTVRGCAALLKACSAARVALLLGTQPPALHSS